MFKGWRTVLVNAGLALAAAAVELLSYLSVFDWRSVLPETYAPYVILAFGVLNIIMRASTSTRMGEGRPFPKGEIEGEVIS